MKILHDKKKVGLISIFVIMIIIAICTYNKNKSKVFKDEYMDDIFAEVNSNDSSEANDTVNKANNIIDLEDKNNTIIVEIKGEVLNPDVYELSEGSIIKDLIDMAGGLTEEANISNINRAQKLQNHELIIISNKNNEEQEQQSNNMTSNTSNINADGTVNINKATLDELMKIPGIGQVKAQSILDYRESNGGFSNIEELMNIDGIGNKTFEKLKDKISL